MTNTNGSGRVSKEVYGPKEDKPGWSSCFKNVIKEEKTSWG